jgi:hypothetical protein
LPDKINVVYKEWLLLVEYELKQTDTSLFQFFTDSNTVDALRDPIHDGVKKAYENFLLEVKNTLTSSELSSVQGSMQTLEQFTDWISELKSSPPEKSANKKKS